MLDMKIENYRITETSDCRNIVLSRVIFDEKGKNEYKKHLVNMTSWNMYVVEDLEGAKVNEYKYEVNYMPESIVPFTVTEKK